MSEVIQETPIAEVIQETPIAEVIQETPIAEPVVSQPTPEEIQAQQAQEQTKSELKYYAAILLSGIKANSSRSQNGSKDVDYVKECVRQSMLLINYVNQLPLNFQIQPPKK